MTASCRSVMVAWSTRGCATCDAQCCPLLLLLGAARPALECASMHGRLAQHQGAHSGEEGGGEGTQSRRVRFPNGVLQWLKSHSRLPRSPPSWFRRIWSCSESDGRYRLLRRRMRLMSRFRGLQHPHTRSSSRGRTSSCSRVLGDRRMDRASVRGRKEAQWRSAVSLLKLRR